MDMRLKFLSDSMKTIDFGMLSTRTEEGAFASRPMSNNGEVDYEGDSYFFTYEDTRTVADIRRDPQVGLTFTGNTGPQGQPPLFIAVEGTAELVRDKAAFAAHWTKGLDRWFAQGPETPGLVMLHIRAARIRYWQVAGQGEITL